ncbi:hypothetical protein [Clostridium scatologenes]|uniref:LSM domain-containing protein n=1 Tax=Clostridium scatologenes TaxID=1548 RepID=A0A0E3JZQ4_CLOSL|nr:hypothetical protein [Clostridium scatologenes]AKA68539.1 hypothetical protein CSCA_1414 [Clostridium scatologenes]
MNLRNCVGKKIKITTIEGEVFEGKCTDFTPALDNEPEVDSIGLKTTTLSYEVYENEIKSIELAN